MVTQKQAEKIQKKIADIKRMLAAEKRRFGAYDDSRGLRYLPTQLFIAIQDYKGGLTYTKWFEKNFPDDSGFPDFLFEWTIILFMNGKLKEAAHKGFQTFCANTYLFDSFFGKQIVPITKWEGSNVETPGYTTFLKYVSSQRELSDFSQWLRQFTTSEKFIAAAAKFVELQKRLKTEEDYETRHYLVEQERQLLNDF